jgi:hypothetical protein
MGPLLLRRGWIIGLLLLCCACADKPTPVQSPAELRTRLRLRWQQGDTLPMAPDSLPLLGIDQIAGFELDSQWVRTFAQQPTPFVQVQRSYWQGPDTYLSLSQSDLATDSSTLYHLLRSWSPIDTSGWHRFASVKPNFWRWRRSVGGTTSLDAVLSSRYLITLQTNHPEGKTTLLQVWREITQE